MIEEAVGKLLARHCPEVPTSHPTEPILSMPISKTVCFVGVENRSIEELGEEKVGEVKVTATKFEECKWFG